MQKQSTGGEKLRCIIIGAGVSGILMAIKLREVFADQVEFWVFEKNDEIGGTWHENRYPGCSCDVPSHIYQFSFCPNPYWSSFYASSAEIRSYLKAVVCHYGLDRNISLRSQITKAAWDEQQSKWTVSVQNRGDFECELLINACGILNNVQYPKLPGLDLFQGSVLHTAAWDANIDLTGKNVAIVGAGASAIQMLPIVAKVVSRCDVYIRTPSWITPPAGSDKPCNFVYMDDEKQRHREDPEFSLAIRKEMESHFNGMYMAFVKGSEEQIALKSQLEKNMRTLIRDTELQGKLIPNFEVGCRRINPGQPYLEALQLPHVHPVFDPIETVSKSSILAGGQCRDVDIIIAATGFDTSFRPRFPILGRAGLSLQDLWRSEPAGYLGIAVAGFPNYLTFLGPNTPISNGSLMGTLEATVDFFVRLIRKFIYEKTVSFEVSEEAQADFNAHTERTMRDMVWTGSCRSWYKGEDGKVRALWPGSSLHYREVLQSNRWEDFHWRHSGNRFAFWGLGRSEMETREKGSSRDLAYYIEKHEPLPLEAYYLAAKSDVTDVIVCAAFRAGSKGEVTLGEEDDEDEGSLVDAVSAPVV